MHLPVRWWGAGLIPGVETAREIALLSSFWTHQTLHFYPARNFARQLDTQIAQ
jgi:hypothetical protein